MARQPKATNTIERSIYFYRVNAGVDSTGCPIVFDPAPALQHFDTLLFMSGNARGLRYLESNDGQVTCCWVDRNTSPQRMRLGTVRLTGFPLMEQRGSVCALNVPPTAGLVEQTHIVFFPGNIVGVEYNFYGPRISRLGYYLCEKANGICNPVQFEALLRSDVLEQLDRLRDVRLFQLNIRAAYAHTLAHADRNLADAFSAAARAGDAEQIELVLRFTTLPKYFGS